MNKLAAAEQNFRKSTTMLEDAQVMKKTVDVKIWSFYFLLISAVVHALWAIYYQLSTQGGVMEDVEVGNGQ